MYQRDVEKLKQTLEVKRKRITLVTDNGHRRDTKVG